MRRILCIGIVSSTTAAWLFVLFLGLTSERQHNGDPAARIQMKNFAAALAHYHLAVGELPEALWELSDPPGARKPFMSEIPLDPWGREYVYARCGERFYLASHGHPDRRLLFGGTAGRSECLQLAGGIGASLLPPLLGAIPNDPWDRPFRYEQLGEHYLLYSLGPDEGDTPVVASSSPELAALAGRLLAPHPALASRWPAWLWLGLGAGLGLLLGRARRQAIASLAPVTHGELAVSPTGIRRAPAEKLLLSEACCDAVSSRS